MKQFGKLVYNLHKVFTHYMKSIDEENEQANKTANRKPVPIQKKTNLISQITPFDMKTQQ